MIPNLFIIGATKCGTTSLHSCLESHPSIVMSSVKEPGYFLSPEERHPCIIDSNPSESGQWEAYISLFGSDRDTAMYTGESSTAYTHMPHRAGVAARLWSHNPDARLIYILRDPIDRAISHYWWNVSHEHERRPLENAITSDSPYYTVSLYATQIKEYYRYFSPSKVYVMTLEEVSNDPGLALGDLLEWLGLDRSDLHQMRWPRENVTPKDVYKARIPMLDSFRYSPLWNRFGDFVPKPIRQIGRRAAQTTVDRTRADTAIVEERIRPKMQEEVDELSSLLNRRFDQWHKLLMHSI